MFLTFAYEMQLFPSFAFAKPPKSTSSSNSHPKLRHAPNLILFEAIEQFKHAR